MLVLPTFSESALPDDDHVSSLLAISLPPVINRSSAPLFHVLDDEYTTESIHPDVVCTLTALSVHSVTTTSSHLSCVALTRMKKGEKTTWVERVAKMVA